MYSQCPDCQTRFRVTADALRAARGTVRCGRCGSAFDALERLSDSIPAAVIDSPPVALDVAANLDAGSATPASEEIHFAADDLERVFVDARDWQAQFGPPPNHTTQRVEPVNVAAEPPIVVVDEETGYEDITLEGERIRIDTLPEPGAPEIDLDATDHFEIPDSVPDSGYPDEDDAEIEDLVKQLTGEFAAPPIEPARPTESAQPAASAEPDAPWMPAPRASA